MESENSVWRKKKNPKEKKKKLQMNPEDKLSK